MKRLFDGDSCYYRESPVQIVVCTSGDEKEEKTPGFLRKQE